MRKNKDDREMYFDNQAYFSNPMMGPPFQTSSMMYYNNGMNPYIPNFQNQEYYNNSGNILERINKLERVIKKLEEKVYTLENKLNTNSSNYQTTNNNYSSNDTYMV